MSDFLPVRTADDLDSLDENEVYQGSRDYQKGDPPPGPNRGRAYWHGWRVAAMNHGDLPTDDDMRALVKSITRREPDGALRLLTREDRARERQKMGHMA